MFFQRSVLIFEPAFNHHVNVLGLRTDKRSLVNLHLCASFALNIFSYVPFIFALNMIYKASLFKISLTTSGNKYEDRNHLSNYNNIRAFVVGLDVLCLLPPLALQVNFIYYLCQAIISTDLYRQADRPIIESTTAFYNEGYTTFNFSPKSQ